MRGVFGWFLLGLGVVIVGVGWGQQFAPYPDIADKAFIKEYVDVHNKFRGQVKPSATNMLYMTFDVALARIAKAYAKKCIWDHNKHVNVHPDPKFRPFGENMWLGSASKKPFNVSAAIGAFYNEVVWASSYKVGCAIAFCRQVAGRGKNLGILVCDYAPAGNYRGERPYKNGRSCSACPAGDTCQNNLCRNPQRDRENSSYSNWYPAYKIEIKCDALCIAVAVLRPLLMFVAFVAVYFLKLHYPGLNFQK